MGWVKLAVGLGVGLYSYRSVTTVNSLVKQIAVPSSSLLAKYNSHQRYDRIYKDAFKIHLPTRYKVLKGTGSKEELFVQNLAKHFFSCKIFRRFEAPLIRGLFFNQWGNNPFFVWKPSEEMSKKISNPSILEQPAFKFKLGDEYLLWRVVARETDQILMEWEVGGFQGATWFYIPHNENCLVFGSSFPMPNPNSKMKLFTGVSRLLYMEPRGGDHSNDGNPGIGAKMRAGFVKGLLKVVTGGHTLYSKYLLLSTYNTVMEEEKRRLGN